ncbi:MAG: ribonuclease III [Rickettsiales bacterium]
MKQLQKNIGYTFNDTSLLELALTHPSVNKKKNYQRLEFLGDSVVGMLVAHIIYDMFPQEKEGELARRLSLLVRGDTLAKVANKIDLGKYLIVSTSEEKSGGRERSSNLEDAMEALIGAIYLDGGIKAATDFVTPRWKEIAADIPEAVKDAKTELQEWAQGRGLPLPSYKMIKTEGSDHSPIFTIEVTVSGYAPATASAGSKKTAQQEAATELLGILKNL